MFRTPRANRTIASTKLARKENQDIKNKIDANRVDEHLRADKITS